MSDFGVARKLDFVVAFTVFFPIVFTEKKSLTVHRQTNKSFASTLSKPIVEPITLLL